MNDVPESAKTQCERILEHLKIGLPLTAHKALYGYGVARVAEYRLVRAKGEVAA